MTLRWNLVVLCACVGLPVAIAGNQAGFPVATDIGQSLVQAGDLSDAGYATPVTDVSLSPDLSDQTSDQSSSDQSSGAPPPPPGLPNLSNIQIPSDTATTDQSDGGIVSLPGAAAPDSSAGDSIPTDDSSAAMPSPNLGAIATVESASSGDGTGDGGTTDGSTDGTTDGTDSSGGTSSSSQDTTNAAQQAAIAALGGGSGASQAVQLAQIIAPSVSAGVPGVMALAVWGKKRFFSGKKSSPEAKNPAPNNDDAAMRTLAAATDHALRTVPKARW